MEPAEIANKKVPLYKLFTLCDRIDILLMIVGSIFAIANGSAQSLMTLILENGVNTFATTKQPSQVVKEVSKVALHFFYLAMGLAIASFLQVSCWRLIGERQATRIRGLYLKTILNQEIAFFEYEVTTAEVIHLMSGETILIQDAMGEKIGKIVEVVSRFIAGFVIAITKGWILAATLLVCPLFLIFFSRATSLFMLRTSTLDQAANKDAKDYVNQALSSMRTVASLTTEKTVIDHYEVKLRLAYNTMVKQELAFGIRRGLLMMTPLCTIGLATWCSSEKNLNGGAVVAAITSFITGTMSLGQVSSSFNEYLKGQAAAYKMFELLTKTPKVDAYDTSGDVLVVRNGDIELKDVEFSYPARRSVEILAKFSLVVPRGTSAALVGEHGCGKSAVIHLLNSFYKPNAGEVLIDGVDLKRFQVSSLREQIGLISEDHMLFSTSIKENLTIGKNDATDEQIRQAIADAKATDFIESLPQGLDTMVGKNGIQLSGGQKLRIAIARLMLKKPKILLIEEAASGGSADDESEDDVQNSLKEVMTGRTTVVVAHRMTTIRNADTIVVVQQGKVVEKGTHDELIKEADGVYSLLIRLKEGEKEEAPFEQVHNKKPNKVSVKRLFQMNEPEFPILIVGSFLAVVQGVIFPLFGMFFAAAISSFFKNSEKQKKDARFWSLACTIAGLTTLLVILQNYLFGIAGYKLVKRLRMLAFETVVHQEISWFDDPANSSGAVAARLSTDTARVKSLISDSIAFVVQNTTAIITCLIIVFVVNWRLAFTITVVAVILIMEGICTMKFLKRFSTKAKEKSEEASQLANDAVVSIRTIASFCAEAKVVEMYTKKNSWQKKQAIHLGLASGFSFLILYCVTSFCFYTGSVVVKHAVATYDDVFMILFCSIVAAIGVSHSSDIEPDTAQAKDSIAPIMEIIDRKPVIDSRCNSGIAPENVAGNIELQHVSFSYPRSKIQIVSDLSLSIPAGKLVAIVGDRGCGKSTLLSLLMRFYDVHSGSIFLDGVDIRKFQIKWLRLQISWIGPEPILFNGTVHENIAYGKEGATEDEIIAAAKAANAHIFISSLQNGYETKVGEGSVQLSQDQKQRISIARAKLKNPTILLLDEPTRALKSELVVQEALYKLRVGRTTIVVAHRPISLRGADIIAAIANGAVAENGQHEDLMKIHNGVYASWVAQHENSRKH